jgi:hypothetical protein
MTRTELPQKMAALIIRNTAPAAARLIGVPNAKGRVDAYLMVDFDGGTPIAVKGRSGASLRAWLAKVAPTVAVQ